MSNRQNVQIRPSQDETEVIWSLYEKLGSMAKVAEQLDLDYYRVRSAVLRDPIRMDAVQRVRAEEASHRWERTERRTCEVLGQLVEITAGMIAHIDACKKAGEMTDLVNPSDPERRPLTPSQAYQWLVHSKQLGEMQKLAFTAAKVSEGLRRVSLEGTSLTKGDLSARDPSSMSNQELAKLVAEMEDDGRPLPTLLKAWKAKHSGAL